ncbi:MAG: alpha/beta fold hydrolase, partial [Rubrobacter sp.]
MDGKHLILLPGMLLDAELFSHQSKHLSDAIDVRVGDITTADTVEGMARSVLDDAPERFALAGLSLGGIVAFEILRLAPERVERLALLDTNARPPTQGQLESWRRFAALTESGRFAEVTGTHVMPTLVHPDRLEETAITGAIERMAENVGPEAFL